MQGTVCTKVVSVHVAPTTESRRERGEQKSDCADSARSGVRTAEESRLSLLRELHHFGAWQRGQLGGRGQQLAAP